VSQNRGIEKGFRREGVRNWRRGRVKLECMAGDGVWVWRRPVLTSIEDGG
jgi:hypothetical protein